MTNLSFFFSEMRELIRNLDIKFKGDFIQRTSSVVISRRCFTEDSQNEISTFRACKACRSYCFSEIVYRFVTSSSPFPPWSLQKLPEVAEANKTQTVCGPPLVAS